jgi:tape measure domain-containing protein
MARMTEILATLLLDSRGFNSALKTSDSALARFTDTANKRGGTLATLFGQITTSAGGLSNVLTRGAQAGAAAALLGMLRSAAAASEAYEALRVAVINNTDSQTEALRVQEALADIGVRTRQGLAATTALWAGIAIAAKEAGRSQLETLKFTEAAQRAIVLSPGTQESRSAAVLQLSQALASNRLQGDEFRSLTENAPRLIRAISEGLGVTRSQLREMSKEGKLTAEVIFGALLSQNAKLASEMGNLRRSQSQANQGIKDELLKLANDNTVVEAFRSLGVKIADAVAWALRKLNNEDSFKLFAPLVSEGELPVRAMRNLLSRGIGVGGAGDTPGSGFGFFRQGDLRAEIARLRDAEVTRDTQFAFNSRPGSAPALFGMGTSTLALTRPEWATPFRTFGTGEAADPGGVAKLYKELEDARKKAADEAKDAERKRLALLEEGRKLADDLAREIARAARGAAAELQVQLAQWEKEMQDAIARGVKVQPAQLEAIRALRQQAIGAQQAIEAAAPTLQSAKAVLDDPALTGTDRAQAAMQQASALDLTIRALEAKRDELETIEASRRNLEAIRDLEAEIGKVRKVRDDAAAAQQSVFELPEAAETAEQMSAAILTSVDGAVALANAFGGVSQSARQALSNITLVARGAVDALQTMRKLRADGVSLSSALGIASLAGAALPVIGGLASLAAGLFAESPEAKQRREDVKRNTEALQQLTARVGDLAGSSVSGGVFSAIGAGITTFLSRKIRIDGQGNTRDFVGQIASASGVSRAEVTQLAETLGVTLGDSLTQVFQFIEAVRQADFAAYTNTFAGSLERLNDSIRADGITDPLEVLRRRVATLSDPKTGFPALASALDGVDLGTVEGRADALDRVRSLFERVQAGLPAGQLGGLSLTDARSQLLELITGLRDTTLGGVNGTGGFNESRTITEVTGSRLAGLLGTGNTYLAQIARNTAPLVQALPSLVPPELSGLGAGRVVFEAGAIALTISVPFGLGGNPAGATAFGERVGSSTADALTRAIVPRLDEALGQRAAERRLLAGDARVVA